MKTNFLCIYQHDTKITIKYVQLSKRHKVIVFWLWEIHTTNDALRYRLKLTLLDYFGTFVSPVMCSSVILLSSPHFFSTMARSTGVPGLCSTWPGDDFEVWSQNLKKEFVDFERGWKSVHVKMENRGSCCKTARATQRLCSKILRWKERWDMSCTK